MHTQKLHTEVLVIMNPAGVSLMATALESHSLLCLSFIFGSANCMFHFGSLFFSLISITFYTKCKTSSELNQSLYVEK